MHQYRIRTAARSFLAGLASLAVTGAVQAQFYAVTDLGTLGGTNCLGYGINNHEQIVGAAQTSAGNYHAFMFDGGRMMDVGTLGGSNSWAYGVNDDGWMAGAAELSTTNMHGFLCTNVAVSPVMMDLGTLGGSNSAATAINARGEMAGWTAMADGSHHAFFMTNAVVSDMMDLGLSGGTNAEACGVNSNRMVVGFAMEAGGGMEPIMSTNALQGMSGMTTMGMGGMGATGGQSWFVNDPGNIAGQTQMSAGNHHAFVSGSGGMMGRMNVDLGTLGGTNSVAYCLNNANDAVGMADWTNGMPHAFLVTNALGGTVHMMDLNNLIPTNSGWELMAARGINSAGQIVGYGMLAGHTNAFLLTPVSEPVMMVSSPAPQIAGPGAPVTLPMQMSASEPLTYQWMHDGMAIPGATNAMLTVPGMTFTNAGEYTVTARNAVGTVASASVAVSLFSLNMTNGMPRLTVAAPAGCQFRIDYADHLGNGANWQMMTNFIVMSGMSQMTDTPPPDSQARFYRAVILP
jgi:probable HAF family extracellular repeat protein